MVPSSEARRPLDHPWDERVANFREIPFYEVR
jgi:hypothetical protein